MKKIFICAAVAALAASTVSCQKENTDENGNISNDALVFTASIDDGMDTRTTLTPERKVNWETDDKISINGVVYKAAPKTDKMKADFTKDDTKADPTGTYNAFYPTGIQTGTTAGGTLPAEQIYTAGKTTNVPMFATSTTTSLSFKNICAVLAVTVKNADFPSVKSIKVSSTNCAMCGTFTVSDGQTAVLTSEAKTAMGAVTLNCGTTAVTTASEGTVFYIAIPAQTYKNLKIELSADGSSYTKAMTTKKDADIAVAVNKFCPITFKADASVLLPGKFSVASDKQVQFTKGNLYYSTTDSKYHVEDAQNVTYATLGQSEYTASHVCLFFWVTPDDAKAASTAPWAETYGTHSWTVGDKFFCGEADAMTVDGQSGLYVLTSDEWTYLLSTRGSGDSYYKANVTVADVSACLVIAPDGYTGTIASSYTAEEWDTAESDGLVCLPSAGIRWGRYNSGVQDNNGIYWTATPNPYWNAAHIVVLDNGSIQLSDGGNRDRGSSVRLVCTASN